MAFKVAYISTYIPRKCGLATYTHNLRTSVNQATSQDIVIALVLSNEEIEQQSSNLCYVRWDRLTDYYKAAKVINQSDVSIVCLQHEFGIFGGKNGSYILKLIKHLKKPLVTTFHTVSPKLSRHMLKIQKEIARLSHTVIVINNKAQRTLHQRLLIPKEKIKVIPHGAPEPNSFDRKQIREELNWDRDKVMMSFGLLNRNKGFEFILNILPHVIKVLPNLKYVIIGETHPLVIRREGEAYRESLQKLIEMNGLTNHVIMLNKYLNEDEFIKYMVASDLFIVPYPGLHQASSGVLSYAVGLGKPVLATPFTHARELLRDSHELLSDYGDTESWVQKIIRILSDPVSQEHYERVISEIGKSIHWSTVGKQHAELFEHIKNQLH
ncbi:glycosyltransferase [Bacillus sp. Marseille-P3661]|uniref:glycosyltransferase n=1 Tax=Bacillus sp. Marseille-P3661 TaxID=1936234 RepID=UPI000C8524F8|nr:glycosyltransferase [Bacillus sp. Marseille-P3661]